MASASVLRPGTRGQLRFQPDLQGIDDRLRDGRAAQQDDERGDWPAHSRLDGIKFADPAQGFGRDRRVGAWSTS